MSVEQVAITVTAEPESIAVVRHFVTSAGHFLGTGADMDVVALLTSELTANAVNHADTDLTLQLDLTPDRLRVEVRDGAAGEPRPRQPRHDDPTGRGLMIVDALADRWGVEPTPPGKTVWFELGT